MEKLGDRPWKTYYSMERKSRERELLGRIMRSWDDDDPDVEGILMDGGALSFPHTYIDSSFVPLLRTVRGIHKTGRRKVIALGVLHRFVEDPSKDEFSLDGLKHVMTLCRKALGLPKIATEERYFFKDKDSTDPAVIVEELKGIGERLRSDIDDGTTLLMTGDLMHYGHGYGNISPSMDPRRLLSSIEKGLEMLYVRKDLLGFYLKAKQDLNDQSIVGMVASTALGGPLELRILSSEMTDYSEVLSSERPTLVASVFYGVRRV